MINKVLGTPMEYVELVHGQLVTLSFELPDNAEDTARDFILYTNGYYYAIS